MRTECNTVSNCVVSFSLSPMVLFLSSDYINFNIIVLKFIDCPSVLGKSRRTSPGFLLSRRRSAEGRQPDGTSRNTRRASSVSKEIWTLSDVAFLLDSIAIVVSVHNVSPAGWRSAEYDDSSTTILLRLAISSGSSSILFFLLRDGGVRYNIESPGGCTLKDAKRRRPPTAWRGIRCFHPPSSLSLLPPPGRHPRPSSSLSTSSSQLPLSLLYSRVFFLAVGSSSASSSPSSSSSFSSSPSSFVAIAVQ